MSDKPAWVGLPQESTPAKAQQTPLPDKTSNKPAPVGPSQESTPAKAQRTPIPTTRGTSEQPPVTEQSRLPTLYKWKPIPAASDLAYVPKLKGAGTFPELRPRDTGNPSKEPETKPDALLGGPKEAPKDDGAGINLEFLKYKNRHPIKGYKIQFPFPFFCALQRAYDDARERAKHPRSKWVYMAVKENNYMPPYYDVGTPSTSLELATELMIERFRSEFEEARWPSVMYFEGDNEDLWMIMDGDIRWRGRLGWFCSNDIIELSVAEQGGRDQLKYRIVMRKMEFPIGQ
ncbi:hypothetical protein GGR56DRAFT_676217 [Xylariaceae sp. FL0804]|nr:hypothetical protein GGR56DRAFT_676217 [Xylariaceae sp. FL0804]